jgi:hypothetical protein
MKYSRIDVETENGETEKGNTKYEAIYGALTEDRNHAVHHPGEQTSAENTTHRLLQEIRNADTYNARSLVDEDAIENAYEESDWDKERTYDQSGAMVGILLGGGINEDSEYEDTYIAPEHLLASEEGREEEILEIVDEYEEQGDMTLRNTMREEYFNNGHDEYEASEVDAHADGSVSMEQIDDFSMADRIADA